MNEQMNKKFGVLFHKFPFNFETWNYFIFDFMQAVVWDNQLTGPFGLIAEYSLLKVGAFIIYLI